MTESQGSYQIYLSSDHWKKLREKAFKKWGKKCRCCKAKASLEVHHLEYRDLYSITEEDLRPLCDECHEEVHEILKTLRKNLSTMRKWSECIRLIKIRQKTEWRGRQHSVTLFGH